MSTDWDIHLADLRAVRAWLECRRPGSGAALVVYRAQAAPPDELARIFVTGIGEREEYDSLEQEAVRVLHALGYRLVDLGGQRLAFAEVILRDMSAHARLEAIARVEEALSRS